MAKHELRLRVIFDGPADAALTETAECALYDLYPSIGAEHLDDDA